MAETTLDGKRSPLSRLLVYGPLILFAAYFLLPLVVMVLTSIKSMAEINSGNLLSLPSAPTLEPWGKAWSEMNGYFLNSFIIVVPAVAISTAIGAFNGFVLTKWRFRGSELLFGMLLVGCFIPFQVILLPMARLLGQLGLAGTSGGLVFVHVVYGLAFTTLFFRNFYVALPDELVKAARIDGAGFFTIFWRIVLPLSGPIIVVCVIWQFTQIWNDFLFGVVYSSAESRPITVALNNVVNTTTTAKEYNVNMAAALLAAAPTLVVYVLAGKHFVAGLTAGAVKG